MFLNLWMDSWEDFHRCWKRLHVFLNTFATKYFYTIFHIVDLLFLSYLSFLQVVNWLEGPGSEQLRTQWGIGDSIRASQALQQKHEEIESQHSVRLPLSFSSSKTVLIACSYVLCILVMSIEEFWIVNDYMVNCLSNLRTWYVHCMLMIFILLSSIEKCWFLYMGYL